MKAKLGWLKTLGLAAVLCVVPFAQADQVQMTLTGLGNGTTASTTLGGVYVGPYQATIGSEVVLVVCADFFIHSQLNQPWWANVSQSGGDISDTRQEALDDNAGYTPQQLYNQAASLVEQLLSAYAANNAALQRQLSFAVWGVFDNSVFDVMKNSVDKAAAIAFRNAALASSDIVNTSLMIYTPVGVATDPLAPPQEFLAIRTPEGSVTLLWGINMLAALGMIVLFRRRSVQGSV